MSGCTDRFETRLIPASHPDRSLALHRSLNADPPTTSRQPAPPVACLLANTQRQGLDLDLLFGAYLADRLVGACVAVKSPGHAATVFAASDAAPTNVAGATAAALRALQTAARRRSMALLEALVDPDEKILSKTLEAAGFHYLARLEFLRRPPAGRAPSVRFAQELQWRSFAPEQEPLFCTALESTYAQSLDCPELTGLRSTSDVLAGHRATGLYDPSLWWVALRAGVAVGVLLLSRIPSEQTLEIVYIGVAQPARGTGVANALLDRAVASASTIGARALTLAVDERNTPALRMYARWGFTRTGVRDAWIASPLRTRS